MKTAKSTTLWIAATLALSLMMNEAFAQVGGPAQNPGKGSISVPGNGGSSSPCSTIEKFTESFKSKVDEFLMDSVMWNFENPPDAATQALGSGTNPYLEEFARMLASESVEIGNDLTVMIDSSVHPYVDRLGANLCRIAERALDSKKDPKLGDTGTRGQLRRSLCKALARFGDKVQDRIESTVASETRRTLLSMIPSIPAREAALMGPAEKRRVEAELVWYAETLTNAVADTVAEDIGKFFDRLRARGC